MKPWDAGMQNERTRLAWQRTLLSGLVCSLVVARLLASISLTLAFLLGMAAVASSAVLGWFSILRYTTTNAALHHDQRIGDGRPAAAVTALVIVTAIGSLLYVAIL